MTLTIQAGKYYRTRDGRKVGPPHIITSAIDGETPVLWRDMTPEQKGLLLLAHHNGEPIETWHPDDPIWEKVEPESFCGQAYRARPAPKVTEHVLWWLAGLVARKDRCRYDTHKITIRHTGDTLPFGTYTGPDGATITVEKAE